MKYAASLSRASRSNERSDRRLRRELSRTSTQPFEYPQGHESFDTEQSRGTQDRESFDTEQSRGAQDRELVERLVERPVEWHMTSRWWISAYNMSCINDIKALLRESS